MRTLRPSTSTALATLVVMAICLYLTLETYLVVVVMTNEKGPELPVSSNKSDSPCYAGPYCMITSKQLFCSPMDFYVHKPLSVILNNALNLDAYISADFVSVLHIVMAMTAAKLLMDDSLSVRRVGCIVYAIRDFLDCLDGVVAKAQMKKRGEEHLYNQPSSGWSYLFDGLSDGIGMIFVMGAIIIWLQQHIIVKRFKINYAPLKHVKITPDYGDHNTITVLTRKKSSGHDTMPANCGEYYAPPELPITRNVKFWACLRKIRSYSPFTASGWPAVHFLIQLGISSTFWNRSILFYSKLLEPANFPEIENPSGPSPDFVITNPYMWGIIYFWRFWNPLNLVDLLLISVFFDLLPEFIGFIQWFGYMMILFLSAFTEIHRMTLATQAVHR